MGSRNINIQSIGVFGKCVNRLPGKSGLCRDNGVDRLDWASAGLQLGANWARHNWPLQLGAVST